MKAFSKIIFVVAATAFFLDTATADPIMDVANQAGNVAADMAKAGIDSAKTAMDTMSKLPMVGNIPGAQQLSGMTNMAANMAKGMVNSMKEMATKASQMLPTNQQSGQ